MKTVLFAILLLSIDVHAATTLKCYSDNKGSCKDGPGETQMAVPTASQGAQADCPACAVPTAWSGDLTANTSAATNGKTAPSSSVIKE